MYAGSSQHHAIWGKSVFWFCIRGSVSGFLPWHEQSREASREDGIAGRKVHAAVCRMETFISWGGSPLF